MSEASDPTLTYLLGNVPAVPDPVPPRVDVWAKCIRCAQPTRVHNRREFINAVSAVGREPRRTLPAFDQRRLRATDLG